MFLLLTILLVGLLAVLLLNGSDRTSAAQSEEERLAAALSEIRGVGRVTVMIGREADDSVSGAVVVAEGAEDIAVRLELLRAAATVLHVGEERVEVFIMGKDGSNERNETDKY